MSNLVMKLGRCAVLALAIVSVSGAQAWAATGNQGYAVYRNGVVVGAVDQWHGGVMSLPHVASGSLPVIHAPGGARDVQYGSWAEFLSAKTYQGTYRPKGTVVSADRDNFLYMARRLADEKIPYSLLYQVNYSISKAGKWVDPGDITSMRCDGVVEYVYEWYGFRVFGGDSVWDVTRALSANKAAHSGTAVTPRTQAQSYLSKVTASLP
jgi:hypothetical protein